MVAFLILLQHNYYHSRLLGDGTTCISNIPVHHFYSLHNHQVLCCVYCSKSKMATVVIHAAHPCHHCQIPKLQRSRLIEATSAATLEYLTKATDIMFTKEYM
jgi:hypothetical protein